MKDWMGKLLFGVVLMLVSVIYMPSAIWAADTDDYIAGGMINEEYGNLTWIVDGDGKLTVEGWGDYAYFNKDVIDEEYWEDNAPPWTEWDISEEITSAEIKVTGMTYAGFLFNECENLVNVDLSGFDTSQVTDMGSMFSGCSSLAGLDLSGFNTSQVTDMRSMFGGCFSLASLDLSSFDTSQVTNMKYMFGGCSSLVNLDLNSLDTSKVTDMKYMFSGCSSLAGLDLSSFDTSQVMGMESMFYGCSSLAGLDLSSFDTSQVTDMEGMFSGCSGLVNLDLSSFNTSQVTTMGGELYHFSGGMFYGCSSLVSLDLSSFNTSQVTYMGGMFSGCSSLVGLDLSSFDTSEVKYMSHMFDGCGVLTYLDMRGFALDNVYDKDWLFSGCSSLSILHTPLSVSDNVSLPAIFHMPNGQATAVLPVKLGYSVLLTRNPSLWVSEEVTEAVTVPFQNQSMNIVWDDSLFEKDAFSYNNNLAVAGLVLSAGAEESQGNINYILKQMGFQNKDICHYNYDRSFNINAPACSIASKEMMVEGSKKTLVAVTVRGSSSAGDWITDVMASGDGFSKPAEYIASLVEKYCKTYCSSVAPEDLLFFITGHSLGGAVASKLDQELCSAYSSGNLYVYSFAPPKYSAGENTVYKNVFEICNGYDIVPYYGGLGSSHFGVPMPEIRGFNGSSSAYLEYYRLFKGEDAELLLPMKSVSHHEVGIYMVYLMANAKLVTSDVVSDKRNTYYITVKCPVDVEIYDAENNLLCSVVDNIYYDHDFPDKDYDDDDYYSIGGRENSAGTYVEGTVRGDEKHLIVSSDSEIKVCMYGTDEGEMSYSVMKLSGIGEVVAERDIKAFKTVVLERNKEFCSKIVPEKNISDVALYVMDSVTDSVIREVDISGEEKDVKPTIVPDKPGEADRPQDTERPGVSQPDVIPSPKPSTGVSPAPVQPAEPEKVSVPKVKVVKVMAGKKKLILKWKKSSGVSGYQIQISTKKNFKGAKKLSISKSKKTYTKKGLKAKKKYYIRIRAYKTYKDAIGKTQKAYGKWSTISKKTK